MDYYHKCPHDLSLFVVCELIIFEIFEQIMVLEVLSTGLLLRIFLLILKMFTENPLYHSLLCHWLIFSFFHPSLDAG
jgi:hypothetical protein